MAKDQVLSSFLTTCSKYLRYILECDSDKDPEDDDDEDPEEDPADYPTDHNYEEDPSGDYADEEDEEQDEDDDDEEKEHPALADSILPPPALRVTARISSRPQPPTQFFTKEDAERFLAMPIPPPSPLTLLSSSLPQIPSPLLSASPPILPIPQPAISPPLQLLSSDRRADRPELLSSDRRADRPKVTLPHQKRLNIVHCLGYEVGESSVVVAARPMEGRKADYGFVDSVEAEIKRRRAEDIGYGIKDTWIDPRDVAKEVALTTLEGVNTRVTELAVVQEQDTQDIYGVMEDTQGRQTEIFERVEALIDDSQYHYETCRLGHLATALGEIRALQARERARAGAQEDPADYLADHDDDDDEEEPSRDDVDEEQDEDNDDEEEEHPPLADSIPPPPALRVTARISFRP
nr:hypothetical protein [Tanacetum cinerariifolium]